MPSSDNFLIKPNGILHPLKLQPSLFQVPIVPYLASWDLVSQTAKAVDMCREGVGPKWMFCYILLCFDCNHSGNDSASESPVIFCLARWPRTTLWLFQALICQLCKLGGQLLAIVFDSLARSTQLYCWHWFVPFYLDIVACSSQVCRALCARLPFFLLVPCHLCHFLLLACFCSTSHRDEINIMKRCGCEVSLCEKGVNSDVREKSARLLDGSHHW